MQTEKKKCRKIQEQIFNHRSLPQLIQQQKRIREQHITVIVDLFKPDTFVTICFINF